MSNSTIPKMNLSLVMTITNPQSSAQLDKLYRKAGLKIQYRFLGEGTATSDIIDYFGLGTSEKDITITVVPLRLVNKLLTYIANELDLHRPGHGIAFSMPISCVSKPVLKMMNINYEEAPIIENKEEGRIMEKSEFNLVIATANQGYGEEIIEAAKEVGVRGGTVIHGRRIGMEETLKFWGISVHAEKEIIAIVVKRDMRVQLMKVLGEKFGIRSDAGALILSLPVDDIVGLGEEITFDEKR